MKNLLKSLLDLFFPELCFACQEHSPMPGSRLCTHCDYEIIPTDYHCRPENPVMDRFWGRLRLERATAQFNFAKGGLLQTLIHQLKYKNRPEIGIELGKMYGHLLRDEADFRSVDLILPVPLHPQKEHLRGYNQAAVFAQGLAESLGCAWSRNLLSRRAFTESQTRKSREERFQNVSTVFEVERPEALRDRHVLLVDDVITTGATLEACALTLLQAAELRLSLAAIALAA